jgi:hypothetical protein
VVGCCTIHISDWLYHNVTPQNLDAIADALPGFQHQPLYCFFAPVRHVCPCSAIILTKSVVLNQYSRYLDLSNAAHNHTLDVSVETDIQFVVSS